MTDQKVSFKYGRIDVSAKLPTGRGIWPAIWMMPVKSVYGGWPRSGEIDIMEYVWGIADDHQTVAATVHTEDIDINKIKLVQAIYHVIHCLQNFIFIHWFGKKITLKYYLIIR